jgi:non-catalytic primase subunit PriX-like protein
MSGLTTYNNKGNHKISYPAFNNNRKLLVQPGQNYVLEHCETIEDSNKEEALARFKQANLLDCRINAYPAYTGFRRINRQTPNFIFIDIDKSTFNTQRAFDLAISKTLKNFKEKLDGACPTILDTGNGCHFYQPINSLILEQEEVFIRLHDEPSKIFLKFAAQLLSNNKSDPMHNPTFKSCMLRIPWSINSKCDKQVNIIQKWDGHHRPAINYLLRDFRRYLIQLKINDRLEEPRRQRRHFSVDITGSATNRDDKKTIISWIESLLQTPLSDHRKYCIWRILSPYLLNVKRLSNEQARSIMNDWLDKCNKLVMLNFNAKAKIEEGLRGASKGYYPISVEKLKKENKVLCDNIITSKPGSHV